MEKFVDRTEREEIKRRELGLIQIFQVEVRF